LKNHSILASVLLWSLFNPGYAVAERSFEQKLVEAAIERTKLKVRYDGAYRKIDYPIAASPIYSAFLFDMAKRSKALIFPAIISLVTLLLGCCLEIYRI
jgi:uncharacterized protein YijF (DUF1287 family)